MGALRVYGERDPIAPPAMARAMQQAAPRAELIMAKNAILNAYHVLPLVAASALNYSRMYINKKQSGRVRNGFQCTD